MDSYIDGLLETRLAIQSDIDAIIGIIEDGREYLKNQNLPQWQNGYGPKLPQIKSDIECQEGFVLVHNGKAIGYAALYSGEIAAYPGIYDGSWDNTHKHYVTISRVAISKSHRGKKLSKPFIDSLINIAINRGFKDIRLDTHKENVIMANIITSAGFKRRGMVKFPFPNGERVAYQRII